MASIWAYSQTEEAERRRQEYKALQAAEEQRIREKYQRHALGYSGGPFQPLIVPENALQRYIDEFAPPAKFLQPQQSETDRIWALVVQSALGS